jgi:putative FmdB family regulatory protein
MPTYSYRCPECAHTYDKLQKISDRTRAKCPKCGTRGERLITGGAGVVFKGSGFYETDYKRSSTKPAADGPAKSPEKPSTKSDSKDSGAKS